MEYKYRIVQDKIHERFLVVRTGRTSRTIYVSNSKEQCKKYIENQKYADKHRRYR